ncbi:MAG: Fe-S cluster assembly ATPase SufC [Bacilli bacterium]|nr:Fe-S cluster assembly ATPase SufC [Bacilli bacterium]MDD4076405.1 Fe-S cluster assembly ATPase SufC [Bacilli bacterium]MDD4388453.1 Fe-S cluster assembly ATPase SufC [Bacilli bacterium]
MRNLQIKNLHSSADGFEILKGVNLTINTGEIHAIMGPNGTGKSTLASTIMGYYKYQITEGDILLDNESIIDLTVDERSRRGIFLAMQYPYEISGITNADFIKAAMQARMKKGQYISLYRFIKEFDKCVSDLQMHPDLPHRYLNEGFSGGEKKRNEILQMKMLKPNFAILDEIDSGLDIDALKVVGENINQMKSDNFGALIITHYQRLLDYIDVNYVHIMMNGQIVLTGGKDIIEKIDKDGYDWLKAELGIEEERVEPVSTVLRNCAFKSLKE